ncbi:hypothetical protein PAERUG_E5_London_17_VIM_2_12_12_05383 [Pseudomonas aeruginosa]|nr:hypothetical protein PAERUG_E5_London_17_VIM_2_12_12_05383 [Pseudomonas aeruginosa]
MEAGFVEAGVAYHLAAELPVRQLLQGLWATPEHADAVGAVELVAGECVEVAAQARQVVASVDAALGAVHQGPGTALAGQLDQLHHRLPGAENVGQLADRQQAGTLADDMASLLQVDHPALVQRQYAQDQAAAQGQLLPGKQVGMVFQGTDQQFVARPEMPLQAIGHQVDRLCGTAGEQHLGRVAGVQPVGDAAARGLEGPGGALAGDMLGAVDVGGAAKVVAVQGVEYGLWLLGGGGAVEVGQAFRGEGGKGRKVGAPGRRQGHGGHCARTVTGERVAHPAALASAVGRAGRRAGLSCARAALRSARWRSCWSCTPPHRSASCGGTAGRADRPGRGP